MKRIISILLVLCFVCSSSVSIVASANVPTVDSSTFVYDGATYTVTIETYYVGTENEYSIITTSGNGDLVTLDTRIPNTYFENGEKKTFRVTEVEENSRASRPTAINHGLSIATGWGYSFSEWHTIEVAETLGDSNVTTLTTLIALVLESTGYGAGTTIAGYLAGQILTFTKNSPLYELDDAFWLRTYTYGYSYVLSQFAYVHQVYAKDYTKIPNGAKKQNTTPYSF